MDYLVFTGPFRELKHLGYEYETLYARNYRCWFSNKIINGMENGRDTRIWAKERRLEVGSLFSATILLLPLIKAENPEAPKIFMDNYLFILDTHCMEFLPEFIGVSLMRFECGLFTVDECLEYSDAVHGMQSYFYRRYREIFIDKRTHEELRVLYKKGWIGIRNKKTGKITPVIPE